MTERKKERKVEILHHILLKKPLKPANKSKTTTTPNSQSNETE